MLPQPVGAHSVWVEAVLLVLVDGIVSNELQRY